MIQNHVYNVSNRLLCPKNAAKVLLFLDICKFLRVFLTKSDVFSEIWLFCAAFYLNLFCFSPPNAKKATHIAVSRSCGIIHGYARIRNPRLPRFLFGGGMVPLFLALLDHLPEPLYDSRLTIHVRHHRDLHRRLCTN